MKASVKYRNDQNPLIRAKVPVSVLGLPFLSSVATGDPKELTLSLSTFFGSGPSLKLSYHPNDPSNPFTFVLKTGVGALGSPVGAAVTVSTEFSLLGRGAPAFFLRFKPRLGDFSLKKSAASAIPDSGAADVFGRGRSAKVFDEPPPPPLTDDANGGFDAEKTNGSHHRSSAIASQAKSGIQGLFSGLEVNARSVLPLTDRLRLKFRWGNRFPDELGDVFSDAGRQKFSPARISLHKVPLLIINKVSIEHTAPAKTSKSATGAGAGDDLADACRSIQKQLEFLRAENGMLRKAVEEIQSDMLRPPARGRNLEAERPEVGKDRSGRKPPAVGKMERWEPPEVFLGKAVEGDVNEELKKALMSATGPGK